MTWMVAAYGDGQKNFMTHQTSPKLVAALATAFLSTSALATDPEIMLHENDLADKGELVATLHSNYTLRGARESGNDTWPEARQTNLMAEFATGLAPDWEAGIHLPIRRAGVDSASSREGAWGSSGVMLRLKHVTTLENGFFYGFNTEYDFFARRFDGAPRGVEFRGIIGHDVETYRITFNPTLSRGVGGGSDEARQSEFRLDAKALYKYSTKIAWGVETYTRWGRVKDLQPGSGDRVVYLVAEFELPNRDTLHLGVGQGFKETPEGTVLKAVWATTF